MTDIVLTAKDFKPPQDVRWCPGCGDYSILAIMQRTLPEFETKRHKYAFVSGIGCSSRFPYYMETYGFHTIHGRAPAIATGLKTVNPELEVWVITGDGDGMSIGGNHLIHAARRNMDLKMIIFNNRIYGLTKGQYSPTSREGLVTKSTPQGSVDHPFNPASLILGAGATFFARTTDRDTKHLAEMIRRAHAHKGFAVIEVLQNCVVYHDGAWSDVTHKEVRDDNRIEIEHDQPMIFGRDQEKGLRLNGFKFEAVTLSSTGREAAFVHDETDPDLALLLARLGPDTGLPTPLGVLHATTRSTYNDDLNTQVAQAQSTGPGDLKTLLHAGDTWTVG